jgi:hypothetical protein
MTLYREYPKTCGHPVQEKSRRDSRENLVTQPGVAGTARSWRERMCGRQAPDHCGHAIVDPRH